MRVLRIYCVGLLLMFLGQITANAQADSSFDQEKLSTFLNTLADEQKIMGTVAIDSAGKEVYHYSVGFIEPETKTKANADTKYRIGSITKMFTATMIMQLVEENRLLLSTKLSEFYPKIPQAENITVKHLLSHQSGLYNFTNAPDYPEWMTEPRTKEQLLEIFYEDDPQFEPGTQTSYSNTNYVLLQFILEDLTGKSYANQLRERIIKPLGLQHTHYGDSIEPEKNEALSFQLQDDVWVPAPETDMSVPGGAGAIVSTPSELITFMRGLFGGELVSQRSLNQMTDIDQQFGLGIINVPFYDRYAYGHTGGIDGFQANVAYFPDDDVTVAFTGNALNYNMNDVLIGVLSIYFGREFEIPSFDRKTISLSVDQMKKFVGEYSSNKLPMDIEIFVEKDTLKGQATGQSSFPLMAEDEKTLRFDQAGLTMRFDSLKGDKYQGFTLHQAGGSFLFTRK